MKEASKRMGLGFFFGDFFELLEFILLSVNVALKIKNSISFFISAIETHHIILSFWSHRLIFSLAGV